MLSAGTQQHTVESTTMPAPARRSRWIIDALAIVIGACAIAVVVPVVQWLDRGSLANNVETTVPNPLGIGVLVGFVLVNALLFLIVRRRVLPPRVVLVLYVMLSIALPLGGVGIISPMFASLQSVAREIYHREGPNLTLHLYGWQREGFFPRLDDDQFQLYMNLRNPDYAKEHGIIDPTAESRKVARPLRQFWDGMYVTPEAKAKYQNPAMTLPAIVRASAADIPWQIWRPVLLRWGGFLCLVILGLMCLTQLFYHDWVRRENLPFPVAQLPLAMLGDADAESHMGSIWRNPFFIGALLVSLGLLFLSGLAHYHLIDITINKGVSFQRIDFNQIFMREPFSFIGNNYLFLSPLLIGIALLVHQDILRGVLWIFAGMQIVRLLTGIFEPSISQALGVAWHGNQMPYYLEIGTGASIVFALYLLWRSRGAFSWRRRDGEEAEGYLAPRWAGLLFIAVVIAIIAFWYYLGLSGIGGMVVAAMVLVWTLIAAIAFSRCRTEGGLAGAGTSLVNNQMIDPAIGWGSVIGANNLRALAHGEWMSFAAISGLLAAQIEGLYLGRRLQVKPVVIAVAVIVAILVTLGVGMTSYMILAYWQGGLNNNQLVYSGMAQAMWQMGSNLTHRQAEVDGLWLSMIVVGVVAMSALLLLRQHFPRFPLPPICLLLVCLGTVGLQNNNQSLHPVYSPGPYVCFIWGPMLIAYMLKKMILRFGGMDLYARAAIPGGLGLIFGQCLMIVGWNIYHLLAKPENAIIFTGVFN